MEESDSSRNLPGGAPLPSRAQARGRRLAIASHPFGMSFQMVFTQSLPTLALLALGASETFVGLQSALVQGCLLLQLPTLRAVGRLPKRRILVGAHLVALLAATPLLGFRQLAHAEAGQGLALALGAFALVAAGISVSNTVWFPLLRSYVEPDRIGRFFGTLRTGWHLTLIFYFLGSQWWLARHPEDFAPLFGVAWLFGVLRVALISRLPEHSERTGERIRIRQALALARDPRMRRYLAGVAWCTGIRVATLPFVIVMLRREVGFSDAAVIVTTVASFAGGLVSLYLWGRAVDRMGAAPVFRWCCLGMGALVLALVFVSGAGTATLVAVVVFFFAHSVLAAGFGVADTHVLFRLTPAHAPSRALVLGAVSVGSVAGLTPLLAGGLLDVALEGAATRLDVYRAFFAGMACLQALAFLPLRGFRGEQRTA
jgi:MFS family permease